MISHTIYLLFFLFFLHSVLVSSFTKRYSELRLWFFCTSNFVESSFKVTYTTRFYFKSGFQRSKLFHFSTMAFNAWEQNTHHLVHLQPCAHLPRNKSMFRYSDRRYHQNITSLLTCIWLLCRTLTGQVTSLSVLSPRHAHTAHSRSLQCLPKGIASLHRQTVANT